MNRRIIWTQIKWILGRKESKLAFFILLELCLFNFVRNMSEFQGLDVKEMYDPLKLLLLSYNRVYFQSDMTLLLMQIYPILVSLPAGFALMDDFNNGKYIYLISRVGKREYIVGKMISSFFATFIVFVIPILIEMGLSMLCFPMTATGDLSNLPYLSREYMEQVRRVFLYDFYLQAPVLYSILGVVCFGVVSGLFGMFTVACSALFCFKYRVLLFLPAFLLLNGMRMAAIMCGSARIDFLRYLFLFVDEKGNPVYYVSVLIGLLLFAGLATRIFVKKDRII